MAQEVKIVKGPDVATIAQAAMNCETRLVFEVEHTSGESEIIDVLVNNANFCGQRMLVWLCLIGRDLRYFYRGDYTPGKKDLGTFEFEKIPKDR